MNRDEIYKLLCSAVEQVKKDDDELMSLPRIAQETKILSEYGFDICSLGLLQRQLELCLDGRKPNIESFLIQENFHSLTIGKLLDSIGGILDFNQHNPIVVYVDDEEENLFIFKRKFGRDLNLKTFSDPKEALDFIISDQNVKLVITDEVMPGIKGNQLCDEVHKVKPFMKFILITGNPENDSDLMYLSLRQNRFFEFIQKPVDYDKKHEEYLSMICDLLGSNR